MPEFHAGCVLRPMEEGDVAAVATIEAAVQPSPWSPQSFRDCLNAGYLCDVVVKDDHVVAYQVVSEVLDEAHLLNIAVAPVMQRKGLAWAMLGHLFARCDEHGMSILYLEVRESNRGAIALYERLGFGHSGRRKAYYRTPGGREDALLMLKVINARA